MHHLTPEQLSELKQKLLEEKARLEAELSSVGVRNPAQAGDWSPVADEAEVLPEVPDRNDLADKFEDIGENAALVAELEARLKDVSDALIKMDAGSYGVDEESGGAIPPERLTANPAARTNVK